MHLDPNGFITRTAALAAGYTDNELRRRAAVGDFRKIGAGIYLPGDVYDALRDEGYQVFRWTWKDLWSFDQVYMRFEKAKARALTHK